MQVEQVDEIGFTADQIALLRSETRVSFAFEDLPYLKYLVDDSSDGDLERYLPLRLDQAWQRIHGRPPTEEDDVSFEDEDEADEIVVYCRGLDLPVLLQEVQEVLPAEFKAEVVPVQPGRYSGTATEISRR